MSNEQGASWDKDLDEDENVPCPPPRTQSLIPSPLSGSAGQGPHEHRQIKKGAVRPPICKTRDFPQTLGGLFSYLHKSNITYMHFPPTTPIELSTMRKKLRRTKINNDKKGVDKSIYLLYCQIESKYLERFSSRQRGFDSPWRCYEKREPDGSLFSYWSFARGKTPHRNGEGGIEPERSCKKFNARAL
jgi:hypothetical protein